MKTRAHEGHIAPLSVSPSASTDASADPSTDPSTDLWERLLEAQNLMLRELRRRLADECTLARFDLLANLEREDGQTPAALSRRMLVTAGNLTGLVDRAERDGLVQRRADPHDRRLSHVHLTPKGRDLVQSILPTRAAHVSVLLAALDSNERRELRRILGKIRASLPETPG